MWALPPQLRRQLRQWSRLPRLQRRPRRWFLPPRRRRQSHRWSRPFLQNLPRWERHLYRGKAGTGFLKLLGKAQASGEFSDILANDNAEGQFYIELLSTDAYLKVDCEITPLESLPKPDMPPSAIEVGTYLVGRDIVPGTYRGRAGSGIFNSCYWARLRDLTGGSDSIINNDNAEGQFFVAVEARQSAYNRLCLGIGELTVSW